MRGGLTARWRFGSGVSMILAPLVWLASSALGPSHQESRTLAGSLPRIAADPDRFLAFILLGLLSHALLIPAVLGIAHLIKGRRPTLAFVGAALVIVGILCLAVVEGVQFVQHQMINPAADREQMVALLQRLEAGIGVKVVFLVMTLGLLLGWVTLSVGLLGTRLVPKAVPASVLASLVLNFAGLEILSRVVLLIGLAWLGVVVLKMRDEAWLVSEV